MHLVDNTPFLPLILSCLCMSQYLGDDLSNDQKAQVFEQTVPCYNNMALCCLKAERFREAAEYANNVSCSMSFTLPSAVTVVRL